MFGLKTILLAGAALAATAVPAPAAEKVVTLDPGTSRVTFTLEATGHDVEGVLALGSGEVRFDPASGAASGEVVVQLAGGKTGNDRRDRQMHEEVLETPKFPVATFRLRRVKGAFVEEGVSQLDLEGVLSFHGSDRPLSVPTKVTARGGRVAAELEVPIPFVAWGLKDPSVFVLRVAKVVAVHVAAEGRLSDGAVAPAGR